MDVHEPQLLQVVCAYRLFMPFASITVSTRECERVRDNLVSIAATKISAGVSTGIGSHVEDIEDKGDDQFEISDGRSVDEVYQALLKHNLQPVMSDYMCNREHLVLKTCRIQLKGVVSDKICKQSGL